MSNGTDGSQQLRLDREKPRTGARGQRIAWAVLALLVVAVLLGLFGGRGPLSATRARTTDGALELRYERLTRLSAPAVLEIRIAPDAVEADEIRLRLDREYVAAARIERVSPPPLRAESGADGTRYVFAVEPGAPALVVFRLKMEKIGLQRGALVLLPDRSLDFVQFVYP